MATNEFRAWDDELRYLIASSRWYTNMQASNIIVSPAELILGIGNIVYLSPTGSGAMPVFDRKNLGRILSNKEIENLALIRWTLNGTPLKEHQANVEHRKLPNTNFNLFTLAEIVRGVQEKFGRIGVNVQIGTNHWNELRLDQWFLCKPI
jgi:hypothetical protein